MIKIHLYIIGFYFNFRSKRDSPLPEKNRKQKESIAPDHSD